MEQQKATLTTIDHNVQPKDQKKKKKKRVFVGNVPYEISGKDLFREWKNYGIKSISLVKKRPEHIRHKGFGFVTFKSPENAEKFVNDFHLTVFHGRMLTAEFEKNTPQRKRDKKSRKQTPPSAPLGDRKLARVTSYSSLDIANQNNWPGCSSGSPSPAGAPREPMTLQRGRLSMTRASSTLDSRLPFPPILQRPFFQATRARVTSIDRFPRRSSMNSLFAGNYQSVTAVSQKFPGARVDPRLHQHQPVAELTRSFSQANFDPPLPVPVPVRNTSRESVEFSSIPSLDDITKIKIPLMIPVGPTPFMQFSPIPYIQHAHSYEQFQNGPYAFQKTPDQTFSPSMDSDLYY